MRKLTEGTKMWMSVMVVFAVYAIIFILFEDYDRAYLEPFEETTMPAGWTSASAVNRRRKRTNCAVN